MRRNKKTSWEKVIKRASPAKDWLRMSKEEEKAMEARFVELGASTGKPIKPYRSGRKPINITD